MVQIKLQRCNKKASYRQWFTHPPMQSILGLIIDESISNSYVLCYVLLTVIEMYNSASASRLK